MNRPKKITARDEWIQMGEKTGNLIQRKGKRRANRKAIAKSQKKRNRKRKKKVETLQGEMELRIDPVRSRRIACKKVEFPCLT